MHETSEYYRYINGEFANYELQLDFKYKPILVGVSS